MYVKKQCEEKTKYGQDKCLGTARESKYNNFTLFNCKDVGISLGIMSHLYTYLTWNEAV